MTIRSATAADHAAIFAVEQSAVGRDDTALLADSLRQDGVVLVELVAEEAGGLVGHILFTTLEIRVPHGLTPAAALGPLAVRDGWQRRGIGGALVRAGIAACRTLGLAAIVVLGHPDYYPRFGFSAEAAATLRAPFSGPSFMALELTPGALAAGGAVSYADAFGIAG